MQFDVQGRKQLISEMLCDMRKTKGYKQADVAAWIGISPQTYNGYEKGRNEPPVEMLVRLSYLYDVSVDLLTQRDRLHSIDESAMETLKRYSEEVDHIKEEFKGSKYRENLQLNKLLDLMQKVIDMNENVLGKKKTD